jgi:hypothetical protein
MKKNNFIFPNRWVAFFDILGFSDEVVKANSDYHYFSILNSYNEVLEALSRKCDVDSKNLLHTWFSDSFIIYSKNDSPKAYVTLQSVAKQFMTTCLFNRVPLRGAISFGPLYANKTTQTFIGKALVEAYHASEEQNWIGFVLTEAAINKVNEYGIFPQRHGFAKTQVPTKKSTIITSMAYTFFQGEANFANPAIRILEDIKQSVPDYCKVKYDNTINHIKHYDRVIERK